MAALNDSSISIEHGSALKTKLFDLVDEHESPGASPSGEREMVAGMPLPSGTQVVLSKEKGLTRYENEFHRVKFMQSEIIVENGLVGRLASAARSVLPPTCLDSNNWLLTDEMVDKLYGDQVLASLRKAGLKVFKVVMPADVSDETGEASAERHKTLGVLSSCVDQILAGGIDKKSAIISLGGGVVNNMAGTISSLLYRGISLVHISTTMMGQVDAALDFKQAVNHHLGKNLMGAYHPAARILLDPTVLLTLSKRHLLNGLSEAIKHAITQSREMLDYIVDNIAVLDSDNERAKMEYLSNVIKVTIAHKVPTLNGNTENDYNEMLPQYGHAVGHAIEFLSFKPIGDEPPQALLHGEAISIGMVVCAEIALLMNVCDRETVEEHYRVFEAVGLPVYVPRTQTIEAICQKLCYDKHFVKCPTMGLPVRIGQMYDIDGVYGHSIPNDLLDKALRINIARRNAAKK